MFCYQIFWQECNFNLHIVEIKNFQKWKIISSAQFSYTFPNKIQPFQTSTKDRFPCKSRFTFYNFPIRTCRETQHQVRSQVKKKKYIYIYPRSYSIVFLSFRGIVRIIVINGSTLLLTQSVAVNVPIVKNSLISQWLRPTRCSSLCTTRSLRSYVFLCVYVRVQLNPYRANQDDTRLSQQLFGFPPERVSTALPTSRIIDGLNSLDSLAEQWERVNTIRM